MADRPTKRQRLDMINTIVVCVGSGDEKQDFTLHQSFAIKSSRFIQAALRGEMKEAREKRVSLPETRVPDFEVYLEWLYTGQLVTLPSCNLKSSGMKFAHLYVLGDYLGDDHFSNTIIDALLTYVDLYWPYMAFESADINFIWEKTPSSSKLREVFIDLIVYGTFGSHGSSPYFFGSDDWSNDVSADVLRRIRQDPTMTVAISKAAKRPSLTAKSNKCAYHVHDDEKPE